MGESNGNDRISVSRDTLRAELGQLELRLVDRLTRELGKKADQRLVDQIVTDVNSIKEHGSPALVTAMGTISTLNTKVENLEDWRNRFFGGLVVMGACAGAIAARLLGLF